MTMTMTTNMNEKLLTTAADEYSYSSSSPSPLLTVRTDVPYSFSTQQQQQQLIRVYHNKGAAVLFLLHIAVVLYCAVRGGWPVAVERRLLGLLCLTGCSAVVLSTIAWHVMSKNSQHFVVLALGSTVVGNGVAAGVLFYLHWWWGVILAVVLLSITTVYLRAVWHRTHVATVQLQFALQAIERNRSVLSLAYGILLALQLYTLIWLMAWLGLYNLSFNNNSDCKGYDSNSDAYSCTVRLRGHGGALFFFFLSFFWTTQVLMNILRVTVAAVVGSFVFRPEQPAVLEAFYHATTFSLGSICFGSLLTAVIQMFYQCARIIQKTSSNNFLCCIIDCMVGFLKRLVVYFHKWSYIYIGLYGDDYLTAGQSVLQLFRERGWDSIVSDQLLIGRTLQLCAAMVGICTGALGLLLGPSLHWSKLVTFAIPAMLGGTVSYILFISVIGAAVDAFIVLFAEAPLELERNHPGLYRQMVSAWSLLYPDEFRVHSDNC